MCFLFQIGLFNKTHIGIGHKYIDSDKSSSFPCELGENKTANLFVKINNNVNWFHNLKEEHFKRHSLSTLRIVVYPNAGKPFKVNPDKAIMKKLTPP